MQDVLFFYLGIEKKPHGSWVKTQSNSGRVMASRSFWRRCCLRPDSACGIYDGGSVSWHGAVVILAARRWYGFRRGSMASYQLLGVLAEQSFS